MRIVKAKRKSTNVLHHMKQKANMASSEIPKEGLSSVHEESESYSDCTPEQCKSTMLQKTRTETQGRQTRPMYCYRSNSPNETNNYTSNASLHTTASPVDLGTNYFMHEQELPSYYTILCLDTISRNAFTSHYCGIKKRKTREQLKKESHSAAVIQSAWRGFQARKQIRELSKAATKIQALFRGFRVRRELNFFEGVVSLNGFIILSTFENDNRYPKIKGTKEYSPSRSELQKRCSDETCYQNNTLTFKNQNGCNCALSINGSKSTEDQETGSNSQISKCSSIMQEPSPESYKSVMSTINSSSKIGLSAQRVSETPLQCQENHIAETQIQAEWKGYQLRKQIRDLTKPEAEIQLFYQSYKNSLQHSSNGLFSIEGHQKLEATVGMETGSVLNPLNSSQVVAFEHGDSVKEKPNMTIKYSDSSISMPPNENIPMNMVMKNKPVSNRPLISIRVMSPNAVVHGVCKDTTMGAQGHYFIKTSSSSSVSQLSVQVNVIKKE
ncbi:uncharacterized protein LOC115093181 [Rhinatrema bivittatum]|uniref:uncharacterized protein LOC115093181 n=1 Tax=Rhinatrema bivittatum TaxID=194408 RepID=UPI00112E4137|nr:uncharacterized protein LOC115093181 [Rhinatrema bivittatum]